MYTAWYSHCSDARGHAQLVRPSTSIRSHSMSRCARFSINQAGRGRSSGRWGGSLGWGGSSAPVPSLDILMFEQMVTLLSQLDKVRHRPPEPSTS